MTRVRRALAALGIAACSGRSVVPVSAPAGPSGPVARVALLAAGSASPASHDAGAASTPESSGPPEPATKVTLADVGLEAGSLDRTADPCIDFYQFACGGWIASNPIPGERASWGRRDEVAERTSAALVSVLEAAASGARQDPAIRPLGDFYASCIDVAGAERAGVAALAPLLARTQAVRDARTWLAAVVALHKLGIFVLWDNAARPDPADGRSHVTQLDAAALGLPARDYLQPERKDTLAGYRAHVGRLLRLVSPAATQAQLDAAAGDVVAIETELAKLIAGPEGGPRTPPYDVMDARGLARLVRSVDWPGYFRALGAAPTQRLIVRSPRMFAALDALRARWKPVRWTGYFTVRLLDGLGPALPRAFAAEAVAGSRPQPGVDAARDRARRCVELTSGALAGLLGQRYIATHVASGARQAAAQLVDALVDALAARLATLEWMTDATRQAALAKLGRLTRQVAYPDRWRTYELEVRRDDLIGNVLRSKAFATARQLAQAGQPVDRGDAEIVPYARDASYDPVGNRAIVPASVLQPPFFGQDRAIAANLGGLALLIGHELTHAFDDQGARLDSDGKPRRWWRPDDDARFAERGKCIAAQYATFEPLPRRFVDGQLTLGESIADLGGVKLAFAAYRALRKDAAKTYVADGLTEDQQFFVAVGQAECRSDRPEEAARQLAVDPRAPPKFRVYGALRNLREFGDAFRCAAGTPMRPAKPCTVW
jgi:putative endopeptidase